jgi:hypothetical protein
MEEPACLPSKFPFFKIAYKIALLSILPAFSQDGPKIKVAPF